MVMTTLRLLVPPQRPSYRLATVEAFCALPSQPLLRLAPRHTAAKAVPSDGAQDAKTPPPAAAATDTVAADGDAPAAAPKSAETLARNAPEIGSENVRASPSFAADLAKEAQMAAQATQIDSPQQKVQPPQASQMDSLQQKVQPPQATKRQPPPGILQQFFQPFQASLQQQADKALDSTVGAAQRKAVALPGEVQKGVSEIVQRIGQHGGAAQRKAVALPGEVQKGVSEIVQQQVDTAMGRLKSLPQDTLNGLLGFTSDRVSDASSGVQTGVQAAVAATVAAPGDFVVQISSEAQRTAAMAAQATGGRIFSLPGSLAAATQQRVSALASEAFESTLALPSELAGAVSLVPIRVQEAVTRTAKDAFDSITGKPKPPPPPPPPRRPLAQRIADFPNEVSASVQSSAEGRVRAAVADTSKLVREIGSAPANIGSAVQAGVSNRVREAAQDTGRLVEEIGSAPAKFGLAVQAGVTGRLESASRETDRLVGEIRAAPSIASSSVQRAADTAANSVAEQVTKAVEGPVQVGRDIAA
eukprot:CAMPEP_0172931018 /NCGR_PEP_ID=MMETSP1075-20121228/219283_1 /TAXON_ID=2916 /ORGANISM="Ceratium fusus, Strain PA161109" /LENGTH=529 /DNA_ID=CAMNT_0013792331 /DNA_START=23 /DNA_END=1609 /DNA_ORIENTATION=+